MKYSFHPEAKSELINSVDYYKLQQKELGLKFLEEIYSTIQRIIEFSNAYPGYSKNTRRCITNKFPLPLFIN